MRKLIKSGYIGNPKQIYTLRNLTMDEGKAKGTGIIEVVTAAGLHLDILPDTGLDIGQVRFKGMNMSWMSKNGYDSPAVINPYETDFVNTFPGGLLYTCGLRSAGPANRDNDEWFPLHGRYHSMAADDISKQVIDNNIIISGTIRETALFGHVLELKRKIIIPIFGSEVAIEDKVSNLSPKDEEYMQIYHCNFGYPLVSEHASLVFPKDHKTIPRTEFAKSGIGRECEFDKPIDGEEERVFFQIMKDEYSLKLSNSNIGITMNMSWSGDTLPILSHWRSMASGDYVLGLEPTNCYIMGRHDERENGTLPVLKAFDTIENKVKINFKEEI